MTQLPAEPYYKVRRRRMVSIAALCGTLAVLAGVYGIGRLRSNPADAVCQPAVEAAARIAPLVHGEVAALSLAQRPFLVPGLTFKDAVHVYRGRDRNRLAEKFAGFCDRTNVHPRQVPLRIYFRF